MFLPPIEYSQYKLKKINELTPSSNLDFVNTEHAAAIHFVGRKKLKLSDVYNPSSDKDGNHNREKVISPSDRQKLKDYLEQHGWDTAEKLPIIHWCESSKRWCLVAGHHRIDALYTMYIEDIPDFEFWFEVFEFDNAVAKAVVGGRTNDEKPHVKQEEKDIESCLIDLHIQGKLPNDENDVLKIIKDMSPSSKEAGRTKILKRVFGALNKKVKFELLDAKLIKQHLYGEGPNKAGKRYTNAPEWVNGKPENSTDVVKTRDYPNGERIVNIVMRGNMIDRDVIAAVARNEFQFGCRSRLYVHLGERPKNNDDLVKKRYNLLESIHKALDRMSLNRNKLGNKNRCKWNTTNGLWDMIISINFFVQDTEFDDVSKFISASEVDRQYKKYQKGHSFNKVHPLDNVIEIQKKIA